MLQWRSFYTCLETLVQAYLWETFLGVKLLLNSPSQKIYQFTLPFTLDKCP